MKILRCLAIGAAILLLFCGATSAAKKSPQTSAPSTQTAPTKAKQMPLVKVLSKIILDNASASYNEPVHLRATLLNPDGKPLGGKEITFTVNPGLDPKIGTGKTGLGGVATWSNSGINYFRLEPGTYVTEARFNGDARDATAPIAPPRKGQLTIGKAPTTFKDVRFTEFNGNQYVGVSPLVMGRTYLIRGQLIQANSNSMGIITSGGVQIAVSLNGAFLKNCAVAPDEYGFAGIKQCDLTLPVSASPASYAITFSFTGNNHYFGTTATKNVTAVP